MHPHRTAGCLADPPAVVITTPSDVAVAPAAALHDVAVRIGEERLSANSDPTQLNTLCAFKAGQLVYGAGDKVRITCTGGPIDGRVVSIQIK